MEELNATSTVKRLSRGIHFATAAHWTWKSKHRVQLCTQESQSGLISLQKDAEHKGHIPPLAFTSKLEER